MISCTLETLPSWSPRNVLSEGCASSTSSTFQAPKLAVGAWKRSYARPPFASPHGSHSSSPAVVTTVWQQFGNGCRRLRSSGSASRDSLWIVKQALLQTEGQLKEYRQLKDGTGGASRSSGEAHLLELDRRGLNFCRSCSRKATKRDCNRSKIVRSSHVDASDENEYCDRSYDQPQGACSFRRSSSPSSREGSHYVELPEGSDPDQSGYTIKVSKELMGVFRYVEKVKRARIKELASTLRQTAAACMFFSCVRGILGPLVEVFQTRPPSWGRLILMLSAFDSFAITYLALKASEPLEKLSLLASESEKDIMGSIEKEEEHMLALAVELVKLFRRLRNIAVCTAVAQCASLVHSLLRLNNPKLVSHAAKIIAAWLNTPWN